MQVMRLGAPVTALSLSPSTDMLATAHAASRGIYLWSNQLLFGTAADMLPSEVSVKPALSKLLPCELSLDSLPYSQSHLHLT